MKKQTDPGMHSAEHILNQTMVRMFNCNRSFSAHIEKKKSKCDYNFERAMSDDEVIELQNRVNDVIQSDLPVTVNMVDRHTAETEFNLKRLPESAGDEIRIVRVGDYDAVPCIGDHVEHTAEIGSFRIISTSFEDGVLRIRFKLDRKPH